jgi:hypothetical protein
LATTAFERGRAEDEEERGGWACTEEAKGELKWAGAKRGMEAAQSIFPDKETKL